MRSRTWTAALAGVKIVVLTALTLLSGTAHAEEQKILELAFRPQEQTQLCWAACTEMALLALGKTASQCSVFCHTQWKDTPVPTNVCTCTAATSCIVAWYWNRPEDIGVALSRNGIKFSAINAIELKWDSVKKSIDNGRPIISKWNWPDLSHYVIIAGYRTTGTKQELYILDPLLSFAPNNSFESYTKNNAWIEYTYMSYIIQGNSLYRYLPIHTADYLIKDLQQ